VVTDASFISGASYAFPSDLVVETKQCTWFTQ